MTKQAWPGLIFQLDRTLCTLTARSDESLCTPTAAAVVISDFPDSGRLFLLGRVRHAGPVEDVLDGVVALVARVLVDRLLVVHRQRHREGPRPRPGRRV